jgi:hypothetical protein
MNPKLTMFFVAMLMATSLLTAQDFAWAEYSGPSCLGPGQQSGENNGTPLVSSPLSVKIRRANPNGRNFYKSLGRSYQLQDATNCATAVSAATQLVSQLHSAGRICSNALNSAQYSCTPNFMNYPTVCTTGVTARVEDTWTVSISFSCL